MFNVGDMALVIQHDERFFKFSTVPGLIIGKKTLAHSTIYLITSEFLYANYSYRITKRCIDPIINCESYTFHPDIDKYFGSMCSWFNELSITRCTEVHFPDNNVAFIYICGFKPPLGLHFVYDKKTYIITEVSGDGNVVWAERL